MIQKPTASNCLKLSFLNQRTIVLMHCQMIILDVCGHQSTMKGQVVNCPADMITNIGDLLPFPRSYEYSIIEGGIILDM